MAVISVLLIVVIHQQLSQVTTTSEVKTSVNAFFNWIRGKESEETSQKLCVYPGNMWASVLSRKRSKNNSTSGSIH